jgi:hypothetical protein
MAWIEMGSDLFGKNQMQSRTEARAVLAAPKPPVLRLGGLAVA